MLNFKLTEYEYNYILNIESLYNIIDAVKIQYCQVKILQTQIINTFKVTKLYILIRY